MAGYQGDEKRGAARAPLTTFCPASFVHKGRKYSAMMTDLSQNGARFAQDDDSATPELSEGEQISVEVRTPYGETSFSGAVIWAKHLDGRYNWGIRFTVIPQEPGDPLQALLHSSF